MRSVQCIKLKQEAEGLERAPLPGDLGQRIFDNVSKQAWQEWLKHQTTLINEKRLSPRDPQARAYLAEQTENHFFGDGAEKADGFTPS